MIDKSAGFTRGRRGPASLLGMVLLFLPVIFTFAGFSPAAAADCCEDDDSYSQASVIVVNDDTAQVHNIDVAGDEDWVPRADLIIYKQQIEQVSTWTFNTPTLVRFALYVSLGIGSWLGAAFVERWLGTLLGS